MNIKEIKATLKPLIKECIREVLMEAGLSKMLTEAVQQPEAIERPIVKKQEVAKQPDKLNENRKKMLQEIGKSGYMNSKFDPFAGTTPISEGQAKDGPSMGPLKDSDPNDPGVDISGLLNSSNKKVWNTLLNGKAK